MDEQGLGLLDEYAAKTRAFAGAVDRLRGLVSNPEAFIRGLGDAGTARRACDRARIRFEKHAGERFRGAPAP